jgi:predicted amidophosphoribosyltransferase
MRCRSCAKMEKRRPTKRPRSARNRRGTCDRCPSPLAAPNARWCPSCARELGRQRNQVYKRRKYRTDVDYRETQKQEKRERYRHDPAFRAHVIARNAKANAKRKRTDLDRLIQRVYQRGRMADPEYRAMVNARAAKRSRERYATDPAYRERLRAKGRRISAKRRARLRQQPEQIAA